MKGIDLIISIEEQGRGKQGKKNANAHTAATHHSCLSRPGSKVHVSANDSGRRQRARVEAGHAGASDQGSTQVRVRFAHDTKTHGSVREVGKYGRAAGGTPALRQR